MFKFGKITENDVNVLKNIIGAFVVKGGALIVSVLLLPAYMRFFKDQTVLGIWYTLLSVLNWITLFDLGLGNGLRNKLPGLIENKKRKEMKEYISTTYIIMTAIALVVEVLGLIAIPQMNWNTIFNIDKTIISSDVLVFCVKIVFSGIMMQIVLKIITSILYATQKSAVVNFLSLSSNLLILIFVLLVPSTSLENNLIIMSWINVLAINVPYAICTIIVFCREFKDAVPSISNWQNKFIKDILNVGISLFWLQLVFMVISSANEILITNLTNPGYVVQYQAYNKIFHTGSMIMTLALTPIWSAVTRAQAQKNYEWIEKIYKLFLLATLLCLVIEIGLVPISQWIMDIWIGRNVIQVEWINAMTFAISSSMMILHNVNTSIGNGLSYFKVQIVLMTFAAIIFVPLAILLVHITNSWIAVVWSSIIALIPYEFIAPVYTMRLLKKKSIKVEA